MRRRRLKDEEESVIDLTPMLDVVFIMLIFFIVTAVFIKEPGQEVLRPDVDTDDRIRQIAILIAVNEDSEIWIANQELELRDVRPMVERMRAENPTGGIVVQADVKADTGVVIDVVDQVRLTGAPFVSVSTKKD